MILHAGSEGAGPNISIVRLPALIKTPFTLSRQELWAHRGRLQQMGLMFGSQLGVGVLGFLIKGVQTRGLGPEDYGLYALFSAITTFSVLFFDLGFFGSLKVLVAEEKQEERTREYFGVGTLLTLFLGVLYGVFLWVAAGFVDGLFGVQLGHILRLIAPLVFVLTFRQMTTDITVGANRIGVHASFDLLNKGLFLLVLLALFRWGSFDLFTVILLNMLAFLPAIILTLVLLKPRFRHLWERYREVAEKRRVFGKAHYTGLIIDQTTYKLDQLFIPYFVNATQLGFYSLAGMICSPMVMMSRAVSHSLFKRFAEADRISPRVWFYNTVWLVLSMGVLILLAGFLVELLFGKAFVTVANYVWPLALAYFFQGMYQPLTFLTAKAQGKAIRNVSILDAGINIGGNLLLIPPFGVQGAIWTSILAKGTHFIGLYYFYRAYLKDGGRLS